MRKQRGSPFLVKQGHGELCIEGWARSETTGQRELGTPGSLTCSPRRKRGGPLSIISESLASFVFERSRTSEEIWDLGLLIGTGQLK